MLDFVVPQAVVKTAREARLAHARDPLDGVGGIAVAAALEGGRIDEDRLKRMRRFFATHGRQFEHGEQLQHTFGNSPLMRTWAMHGGEAGRVWVEATYAQAVGNGLTEDDPYVDLLRTPPDELYGKLNLGAWRWEYDMSPAQAARFVDEYHRATGMNIDLDRAFGTGRVAVSTAIQRRAMNANPFQQLARTLLRDEYRAASKIDLKQIKEATGRPAFNWSEFIGYALLGSTANYMLRAAGVFEGPSVPGLARDPEPVFAYSSPLASYVTYFHPQGAMFEAAKIPSRVQGEMANLMWQLGEGEVSDQRAARRILGEACRTLGRCRLSTGLGHVLLEAWERGDWDEFEQAIPLDSLIRAPFERFKGVVDPAAFTA